MTWERSGVLNGILTVCANKSIDDICMRNVMFATLLYQYDTIKVLK